MTIPHVERGELPFSDDYNAMTDQVGRNMVPGVSGMFIPQGCCFEMSAS